MTTPIQQRSQRDQQRRMTAEVLLTVSSMRRLGAACAMTAADNRAHTLRLRSEGGERKNLRTIAATREPRTASKTRQ